MKIFSKVIAGIGVLLIASGFIGAGVSNKKANEVLDNDIKGISSIYDKRNNGNRYTGMMGDWDRNQRYNLSEYYSDKLGLATLEEKVKGYLEQYSIELEISDIFVYDDSDYYYSVIEKETGRGAMELLVNPYTGNIYPEIGPNMMWNLKYGMHYGGNKGIMGNRGMMRRGNYYNSYGYINSDFSETNDISKEEACTIGNKYISKIFKNTTISENAYEFYGYYTFHIEKKGVTIGMLSVNGFTGEVWYHNWHGKLVEVLEGH